MSTSSGALVTGQQSEQTVEADFFALFQNLGQTDPVDLIPTSDLCDWLGDLTGIEKSPSYANGRRRIDLVCTSFPEFGTLQAASQPNPKIAGQTPEEQKSLIGAGLVTVMHEQHMTPSGSTPETPRHAAEHRQPGVDVQEAGQVVRG